MPIRIIKSKRIIVAIGISIERLRISSPRNNRIGANKPADGGVIVAGAVVVEAGAVQSLAGKELIRSWVALTFSTFCKADR